MCEEREYQQDATIQMFIINLSCLLPTTVSTCFGHHYAHHQENKDRVLLHMVFCTGSVGCGWLQVWGVAMQSSRFAHDARSQEHTAYSCVLPQRSRLAMRSASSNLGLVSANADCGLQPQ